MKPNTLALTQRNHRLLLTDYNTMKQLRIEGTGRSFLLNKADAITLGQTLLNWGNES